MVTGANGGYGSLAIEFLEKIVSKENIFALVRSEEKWKKLQEKWINVRIWDYADINSLKTAFEGIDRLLFVSNPIPWLHKNVVEAAKFAGIDFIAYTSLFGLENSKFGLEINHRETEEILKNSGIKHMILRNSWYLEINKWFVEMAKKTKKFYFYSGENVISAALKSDYAEVWAKIISAEKPEEWILNLASNPFSYKDLALEIEKALWEKIEIIETSKEIFEQKVDELGLSPMDSMLMKTWQTYTFFWNNGEEMANSKDFEKILGREISISDSIKKL